MTKQKNEAGSRLNPDLDYRIVDEFTRGVSRREMLSTLLACGIPASTAGELPAQMACAAQTPKRGGRIRVASSSGSAADTLDPAKGSGATDYTRAEMFYNGLTRLDASRITQMVLAESIDNKGALLWTIKLRKDVRFHDGKPFTSADVVYSLLRHKHSATGSQAKAAAEQFEEVKATGTHEVRITLTSPNADLPVILGTSHFLIIKEGTSDFTTAIGTGTYKC